MHTRCSSFLFIAAILIVYTLPLTKGARLVSCAFSYVSLGEDALGQAASTYRLNLTFDGVPAWSTVEGRSSVLAASWLYRFLDFRDSDTNFEVRYASRHGPYHCQIFNPTQNGFFRYRDNLVNGSSILILTPRLTRPNVTVRVSYWRPPLYEGDILLADGQPVDSFTCEATMPDVPRLMTVASFTSVSTLYPQLSSDLAKQVFMFSDPVQQCSGETDLVSDNFKTYDDLAFGCTGYTSLDEGRVWFCTDNETNHANIGAYISDVGQSYTIKPLKLINVCTVTGNRTVVTDYAPFHTDEVRVGQYYFSQGDGETGTMLTESQQALYLFNMTTRSLIAVLPQPYGTPPLDPDRAALYYNLGRLIDPEAMIFALPDYKTTFASTTSTLINGYFTAGSIVLKAAGFDVTQTNPTGNSNYDSLATTQSFSRFVQWLEFDAETERYVLVIRFYSETDAFTSSGSTFAVAMQENTTNLLSVGTLQESSAQIRANAYRTYRFSTGALKSNTIGYIWRGSSLSYACSSGAYIMPAFASSGTPLTGDPLALNLSDSTSIRLKSVNFSLDFSTLVFYFQNLNSTLAGYDESKFWHSCGNLTDPVLGTDHINFTTTYCSDSLVNVSFDAVSTFTQAFHVTSVLWLELITEAHQWLQWDADADTYVLYVRLLTPEGVSPAYEGRLASTQDDDVNLLSGATAEHSLDAPVTVWTWKTQHATLRSSAYAYLWQDTDPIDQVSAVNLNLSDSSSISLKSANFSSSLSTLTVYFQGLNSALVSYDASKFSHSCGSLSSPVLGTDHVNFTTTHCITSEVTVSFDAVSTFTQAFHATQSFTPITRFAVSSALLSVSTLVVNLTDVKTTPESLTESLLRLECNGETATLSDGLIIASPPSLVIHVDNCDIPVNVRLSVIDETALVSSLQTLFLTQDFPVLVLSTADVDTTIIIDNTTTTIITGGASFSDLPAWMQAVLIGSIVGALIVGLVITKGCTSSSTSRRTTKRYRHKLVPSDEETEMT